MVRGQTEISIYIDDKIGEISALVDRPEDARVFLTLGHGAGAGMRHPFMNALVERLRHHRVATLRYQFPYMERGRKRPDHWTTLVKTVRAAVAAAEAEAGTLPLFAGGKSMGGRMTSTAQAKQALPAVRGLVFFGFPLHPAGRDGVERGEHLAEIDIPKLFLQGTRDRLARADLLEQVCAGLGSKAKLDWIDSADHGFHVLKRSGRTDAEALDELAAKASNWMLSVA